MSDRLTICLRVHEAVTLLVAEAIDHMKNIKEKMGLRSRRFVSGGMDRSVKIWKENPSN